VAQATRRSGRRRNGGSSPSQSDRIIEATFALLPTEGWRRLSLAAIASRAELPVLQVYRVFRSKQAILCGFFGRVDEAVLADPPPAESDERPRDRLFDLLMRRFDALQPYKAALDVLGRELPRDPLTALCAAAALFRSMRWMLETADIPTVGARGTIAVKLALAAYLSTIRIWQRDDSPDLGQTMAALDARLRRIERWLVPSRSRRSDSEPAPA
jgi:AcrR family transcriptional regulator